MELSNHIIMARTKHEEKALAEELPKKKNSVGTYLVQIFEKNHNKKSLEDRFQRESQTAINDTEHNVTSDSAKTIP